jgi:hypothetical protein
MLPGQTERYVQEHESELEQDQDPHPGKIFKARPNAEEMEQASGKFLDVMPAVESDHFSFADIW